MKRAVLVLASLVCCISVSSAHAAEIVDLSQAVAVAPFGSADIVKSTDISENRDWVAIGYQTGEIAVWHIPSRSIRYRHRITTVVDTVGISEDGSLLAIHYDGSDPNTNVIEVYDLRTDRRIASFARAHHSSLQLRFDPSGRYLATADDPFAIDVFDLKEQRVLKRLGPFPRRPINLHFTRSRGGEGPTYLAATVESHGLFYWPFPALSSPTRIPTRDDYAKAVYSAAVGKEYIFEGYTPGFEKLPKRDARIRRFDPSDLSKPEFQEDHPWGFGHGAGIVIDVSPDGRQFVSGEVFGDISVYDIHPLRRSFRIEGHQEIFGSRGILVAKYIDAHHILFVSQDSTVAILDTERGQVDLYLSPNVAFLEPRDALLSDDLRTLFIQPSHFQVERFVTDRSFVAAYARDGRFHIPFLAFDLDTGRLRQLDAVWGAASSDGRQVILAGKPQDDESGNQQVMLSVFDTDALSTRHPTRVESYRLRRIAYSKKHHRAFLADAAGFRSVSLSDARPPVTYTVKAPCEVSEAYLVNGDRHFVGIDECRISVFQVDVPATLAQIDLKSLASVKPCPTHTWGDLLSFHGALYRIHGSTGLLCRVALHTQSISHGLDQYPPRGGRLEAFAETLDGDRVFVGTEIGLLVVLQRQGGGFREIGSRPVCRGVGAVRRHSTGPLLVITCREKIVFFDSSSLKVVGEIAFFPNFRWIAIGSDRFATNDYEYLERFGWRPKGDGRAIVPFEFLAYSRIEKSAADALFKSGRSAAPAGVNVAVPHVQIRDAEIYASNNGYVLRATVEVQTRADGGASDLKVFLNDRLVREYPAVPARAHFTDRRLPLDGSGRFRQIIEVPIPVTHVGAGQTLTAFAFNDSAIRGPRKSLRIAWNQVLAPIRTRPLIRIVGIGIDDYRAPELRLNFTTRNTEDVVSALAGKIRAAHPGAIVETESLTAPPRSPLFLTPATAASRVPTRSAILDTLVHQPGVEHSSDRSVDLLIVYFNGHAQWVDGQFGLLPQDAEPSADGDLPSGAITNDLLADALRAIASPRVVLILDTCHAAGAVAQEAFRPGPFSDTSLAQTVYDKATSVLVASDTSERANARGQTALSRALLDVLQRPSAISSEQRSTLRAVFDEVEDIVSDESARSAERGQSPKLLRWRHLMEDQLDTISIDVRRGRNDAASPRH